MRRLNAALTFRLLREADAPLTMAQLTRGTELSRRTVELILADLLADGWVREVAVGSTGVGRPPRAFAFQPDNALFAAVQVDTHSVRAGVADTHGRLLSSERRVLSDYYDPATTLEQAVDALNAALVASGRPVGVVRAGAVAMPGLIDDEGLVLGLVDAPTWTGVRPSAVLAQAFPFPFVGDNDANLAAVGERWKGAAQGLDSFTWLLAGARNGAGIVIRGEVHRGFRSSAGEIVRAPAVGMSELHEHPLGGLTHPDPQERARAERIVERVRSGDRDAADLLDEFTAPLARVLVTLVWTIAPPLVVLGGGLEVAADVLVPRLETALAAEGAPAVPIRATSLGGDAVLLGALHEARASVDDELLRAKS
ncbi:putative NBD/HSP70 family sugar kinase [Kineococcus rhizosphaerae]|uniref:Putative NBD/HSP70 family sugar kinase n=2 Tax=Kineococcus rhizosphaerae TaxID=559628 RepID=A0A2T0R6V9_9ACTN|nr:putative NBD/HSP70 family sugar kinase [Kineococcus rhizosphaerae]